MGRTACREPQRLYKGDLYLYLHLINLHVNCLFTDVRSSRNTELLYVLSSRNRHPALLQFKFVV